MCLFTAPDALLRSRDCLDGLGALPVPAAEILALSLPRAARATSSLLVLIRRQGRFKLGLRRHKEDLPAFSLTWWLLQPQQIAGMAVPCWATTKPSLWFSRSLSPAGHELCWPLCQGGCGSPQLWRENEIFSCTHEVSEDANLCAKGKTTQICPSPPAQPVQVCPCPYSSAGASQHCPCQHLAPCTSLSPSLGTARAGPPTSPPEFWGSLFSPMPLHPNK